jgi:hypothetical protein
MNRETGTLVLSGVDRERRRKTVSHSTECGWSKGRSETMYEMWQGGRRDRMCKWQTNTNPV